MHWLDEKVTACGDLCDDQTIGASYEGRPLKLIKVRLLFTSILMVLKRDKAMSVNLLCDDQTIGASYSIEYEGRPLKPILK